MYSNNYIDKRGLKILGIKLIFPLVLIKIPAVKGVAGLCGSIGKLDGLTVGIYSRVFRSVNHKENSISFGEIR